MLVNSIKEVRQLVMQNKKMGKSIGFVPTMGFLHEGHLSLIKRAKKDNDFVIVSIFVNPIQFGPGEDYEVYPRDIDGDYKMSLEAGGDMIFSPSVLEMYPQELKTFVDILDLSDNLCGASRPGHFKGVATVVTKLFNIVLPNKAYFGQKDAQQVAVIKRIVTDLNMDLEVVSCPIVREDSGLALSSRNVYLKPHEKSSALLLSQSLFLARDLMAEGETNCNVLKDLIVSKISNDPNCQIDYVKIVDNHTLKDLEIIKGEVLIALAVKIGNTRLIDNITLEVF